MTDATARHQVVSLTPRRELMRTAAVSVAVVGIPVFGVLSFLGLHNGIWRIGAIGALLTIGVSAYCYRRYRHTRISITDTHIEECGFWGRRTSFRRADAAAVDIAHTRSVLFPDPTSQLVVRGADGRCLLRMRGVFWTEASMTVVAEHLEPVPAMPEPMTRREFHDGYPGATYWFESRPVLAGMILAVGVLTALAVIFVLSTFVND